VTVGWREQPRRLYKVQNGEETPVQSRRRLACPLNGGIEQAAMEENLCLFFLLDNRPKENPLIATLFKGPEFEKAAWKERRRDENRHKERILCGWDSCDLNTHPKKGTAGTQGTARP